MISVILSCIIISYLILIGLLIIGFDKVADFVLQDLTPVTRFSVVIPFRNEAEHLPFLLKSITELNYPTALFEVLLVDDFSEDDSIERIEVCLARLHSKDNTKSLPVRVIKSTSNSKAPKKAAITLGIKASKFEWIITSDADCILPRYWLDSFDEYIQIHQPKGLVGPVCYQGFRSFLGRFQGLELLSLQAATIGGFGLSRPFMNNGANFAYRKSDFYDLCGFEATDHIASGDDVGLLEKFVKRKAADLHYLKAETAIVTTTPEKGLSNLVQQRLRWASKTKTSQNWFSQVTGILILLGNLGMAVLILAGSLSFIELKIAIALFVIKFSIDFLLVYKSSRFFNQENLLFSYVLSSLIYPFFNVYVGVLSLFKSYKWKGRTFKI